MLVKLEYHDDESLLIEEVIKRAKDNYGSRTVVKVLPESDTPIDYLYFALQRLVTGDQLSLFYESGATYQKDIEKLRAEALYKVGEVLNDVLIDNEHRLCKES